MTFIPPARIEARAADVWRRHQLTPNFDVEQLLDALDLNLLWTDLHPNILAEISPFERRVTINEQRRLSFDANRGLYRFTLAHEIGHWYLHAEPARSGTGLLFEGSTVFCRDDARNQIETQAHKFAGALLAPRDKVVAMLPASDWQGWSPVRRLAEPFGMSLTAMFVRLCELGLAHKDAGDTPASGVEVNPHQPSLF